MHRLNNSNFNHHKSSGWRGGGLRQRLTLVKLANCVGSASAVALGLLALVLLSPNIAGFASAESATTKLPVEVQAGYMLSLAMDHNSVSMEGLIPTREGVFSAQSVKLTVETNATDGYKLYVNTASENNALTKVSEGSVGTIESLSVAATSDNFPKDKWGYSLVEGENQPSTYNPVPSSSATGIPVETKNAKHQDYTLGFATKVSTDIPAGTYRNEVVVSAVTNPETIITLDKITTMQEMTPQVCANTLATNAADLPAGSRQIVTPGNEPSKQLMDTRDNKWYWVSKLADQNCWMTQNLDLDIPAAGLKAVDTDITSDWNSSSEYPPVETRSGALNIGNAMGSTSTISWDMGDYVLINPTDGTACPDLKQGEEFSGCSRTESYNGTQDRHYLIGNYYQWTTATAGTGGGIIDAAATGSICPKGWTLPDDPAESQSYENLITKYGVVDGDEKSLVTLVSAPLYLPYTGVVNPGRLIYNRLGEGGHFWSKTATEVEVAYEFYFAYVDSLVKIAPKNSRYVGRSVRCVAY